MEGGQCVTAGMTKNVNNLLCIIIHCMNILYSIVIDYFCYKKSCGIEIELFNVVLMCGTGLICREKIVGIKEVNRPER